MPQSHDREFDKMEDLGPVDLKQVVEREWQAIARRRQRAFGAGPAGKDAPADLFGLALSGGGIRAAAISLGFLEALRQRDATDKSLLQFVDYLSTVSGGGYTGAYFSSHALASADGGEHRNSTPQVDNGAAASEPAEDDRKAPPQAAGGVNVQATAANRNGSASPPAVPTAKVAGAEGELDPRTLKFVYGGNYLRKTWLFFNRYLIGLLLVWTVLISGLLALAAAATIALRSLEYPVIRTALEALDFNGDVKLAFFPSFIVLLAWIVAWGVSYWKFNARASGAVAHWLFYLLVIVTLTAVAALIGAGDLSPLDSKETGNAPGKTIFMLVLSGVAASLLPYLAPKKLLRSGMSPRNVAEKYVFWTATRAVAYGIPFAAIAFLARENISGWNDRRDDRLVKMDIPDWTPANPMFRELSQKSNSARQPSGRIWPNESVFAPLIKILKPSESDLERSKQLFSQLVDVLNSRGPAETDRNEWETIEKDKKVADDILESQLPNSHAQGELSPSYHPVASGRTLQEASTSCFDRWGHFLAFLWHHALLDSSAAESGQFYADWNSHFQPLQLEDRLAYQINKRLSDPEFYKKFWPINTNEIFNDEPNNVANAVKKKKLRSEFRAVYRGPAVGPKGLPTATSNPKFEDEFVRWRENLSNLAAEAKQIAERPPDSWGIKESQNAASKELNDAAAEENKDRAVLSINRRLLSAYYGDRIRDKSIVYSANVLHEDQRTRFRWLLWCSGIFLVASMCMDLNATSLHGFYSTQVGQAWIEPSPTDRHSIPLVELRTTDVGKPYHLINGTIQLFGVGTGKVPLEQENFLFSQLHCGCSSLKYARTTHFMDGMYGLDDAIAVSGGAISPALSHNPLVLVLLWLANMRLGQWVDNPSYRSSNHADVALRRGRWPVTPFRVLINLLRKPAKRRMCFVTDGGHYENLGIEPLLLRGCRLIVAFDACQDGDYSFSELTRLVRRMRMTYGVTIVPWNNDPNASTQPLRLDALKPPQTRSSKDEQLCKDSSNAADETNVEGKSEGSAEFNRRLSDGHFVVLRVRYREGHPEEDGCLVYAKSTLTGDEPFDLAEYAKANKCFPHDETADQFFDPNRFESYRQLGFHIGNQVCKFFGRQLPTAIHGKSAALLVEGLAASAPVHDQQREVTPPESPARIDDTLKQKLAIIEQLLEAKNEKAAAAAMEKLFEEGPAILSAMHAVLRLIPRFDPLLFNAYANLREFMSKYPRESVDALCGILVTNHSGWIKSEAIRCLEDVWENSLPKESRKIIKSLTRLEEPNTPTEVVEAVFSALTKIAPKDQVAREKARELVKRDLRKPVVRCAKRFLSLASD